MAHQWFVKYHDQETGPLSSGQLKTMADEGRLGPDDPVRLGQEGRWVSARQVKGLSFRTVSPSPPIPSPSEATPSPPPLPPVLYTQASEARAAATAQDHAVSLAGLPETVARTRQCNVPLLKRLRKNTSSVLAATFAQTDRLVRYVAVIVRRRHLANSLREARLSLGERMHRESWGDKDVIAQIRDTDERIAQARSMKQPASLLLHRRRQLQSALADSASNALPPLSGCPEYDTVVRLQEELRKCQAMAIVQLAQLPPPTTGERWRVGLGYSLPVLVLTVTVILIGSHAGYDGQRSDAKLRAADKDIVRESHDELNTLNEAEDVRLTRSSPLFNGKPITHWIAELKKGDLATRREAALALGGAKTPNAGQAVTALAVSLRDGDVRAMAALALGKIGEEGVPALIKALKEGDETVNPDLVTGLVQAGRPAVTPLIQVLSDGNRNAVASASTALGLIGGPGVPDLIDALDDSNPQVRSFALLALQQMGPQAREAVPAIKRRLSDSHPKMRELAEEALKAIPADDRPPTPAPDARNNLAARELGREILEGISRLEWLRRNPKANLVNSDPRDGLQEYFLGDNLVRRQASFMNDRLVGVDLEVIRVTREAADKAVDELIAKLGPPHSQLAPADAQDTIRPCQWKFPDENLFISCSIVTGTTNDGVKMYYYQQFIGNEKAVGSK